MEVALRRTYDATPDPKLVVAVGDCGACGGGFGEGYASLGAVSNVIPVDVVVPGCPPSPTRIMQGILTAISTAGTARRGCGDTCVTVPAVAAPGTHAVYWRRATSCAAVISSRHASRRSPGASGADLTALAVVAGLDVRRLRCGALLRRATLPTAIAIRSRGQQDAGAATRLPPATQSDRVACRMIVSSSGRRGA
jgi:hypothetical protein